MRSRARIGINCVVRREDAEKITLSTAYIDGVSAAGGLAVVLPPLLDREQVRGLLDGVDGLLLTGGRDYDPASYGGSDHESVCRVDPRRESFDRLLAEEARERQLPTLGICCGAQLINIVRGGTLDVEIREAHPGALDHGERAGRPTRHPIEVEEGSRLHALLGARHLEVNSQHHQAVARAGRGLRVVARGPDGVVEAIEGSEELLIGVQWHPELLPGDPAQRALFGALVQAAEARRQGAARKEAS